MRTKTIATSTVLSVGDIARKISHRLNRKGVGRYQSVDLLDSNTLSILYCIVQILPDTWVWVDLEHSIFRSWTPRAQNKNEHYSLVLYQQLIISMPDIRYDRSVTCCHLLSCQHMKSNCSIWFFFFKICKPVPHMGWIIFTSKTLWRLISGYMLIFKF